MLEEKSHLVVCRMWHKPRQDRATKICIFLCNVENKLSAIALHIKVESSTKYYVFKVQIGFCVLSLCMCE